MGKKAEKVCARGLTTGGPGGIDREGKRERLTRWPRWPHTAEFAYDRSQLIADGKQTRKQTQRKSNCCSMVLPMRVETELSQGRKVGTNPRRIIQCAKSATQQGKCQ